VLNLRIVKNNFVICTSRSSSVVIAGAKIPH
jgi:hypothetical protein